MNKTFLSLLLSLILGLVLMLSFGCDEDDDNGAGNVPEAPIAEEVADLFPLGDGLSWVYLYPGDNDTTIEVRSYDTGERYDGEVLYRMGSFHVSSGMWGGNTYSVTNDSVRMYVWDEQRGDYITMPDFYSFPWAQQGAVIDDDERNFCWRVWATDSTMTVPAGTFEHCYVVRYGRYDNTDPRGRYYKAYAPEIGLIKWWFDDAPRYNRELKRYYRI